MRNNFIKHMVLNTLILSISINIAHANTTTCSKEPNFSIEGNNILFLNNKSTDQFYFKITNIVPQSIYLNKIIAEPSASAGWSTKLDNQHYSILALTTNEFLLSCGYLTKNGFKTVNCSKILTLCQLTSPVLRDAKLAEKGNYWVVENEVK